MIDVDLFAGGVVLPPALQQALIGAESCLAAAAKQALLDTASFSERYLSPRRAHELASQLTAQLCAQLHAPANLVTTRALECLGSELAAAGLLREAVGRLLVAWSDAALAAVSPPEVACLTAWLSRATAAIQAGFERGRYERTLEQQEGLRQALTATLREHEQQEQRLLALVAELSTPVIPVLTGVLVLPLVGTIDSRRAQQITEQVLEAVERERAATIVLDITGVITVDTQTAQLLLRTAQAVRLLGAEPLLVGISPEVAQTMISLGVELRGLHTFADLRAGLAYALARQGLAITPTTVARASLMCQV